jgi:hypothetical protein
VAAGAGFDEDLRRGGGSSYWLRSARAAAATIVREGHRQLLDLMRGGGSSCWLRPAGEAAASAGTSQEGASAGAGGREDRRVARCRRRPEERDDRIGFAGAFRWALIKWGHNFRFLGVKMENYWR